MLFAPPPPLSSETVEELVHYSRTLHDYTLHLWTESRRLAEEKAHGASKGRRAQQRYAQQNSSGSSEESSDDTQPTARRGSNSSNASVTGSGSGSETSEADEHSSARGASRMRSSDEVSHDRERQRKHRRTDGSSADLRTRLAAVTL